MKRTAIVITALCVVLCILLSGCSFSLTSIDKMMHPPALSGENSGIQKAFEKAVNEKNITMKTPTSGDYRSSYVLYDFDGDGDNEAIAFYSNSSDETVVYMHFLDLVDGEWKSVASIKGLGSEVYKIDFCDMNSDGISEIVVCWSLYESRGNKVMTVYEPDFSSGNFVLKSIVTESFSQSVTCDIDNDGRDEIFNVVVDTTSDISKTYGRLFRMNDENYVILSGEVVLTPAISISSLRCEDGQNPRIFVDSVINDTEVITDVICCDSKSGDISAPLTESNSSDNPPTVRAAKLACVDIDKDGRYEIPVSKELLNSYSKSGDDTEPLDLTVWLELKDGVLSEKTERLMFYSSSYMFTFEKNWEDTVCVENNISERTAIFYLYDDSTGKNGSELFRIITVSNSDWEHKPKDGYTVVLKSSALTYAVKITDAGTNMKITEDFIKSHINTIE